MKIGVKIFENIFVTFRIKQLVTICTTVLLDSADKTLHLNQRRSQDFWSGGGRKNSGGAKPPVTRDEKFEQEKFFWTTTFWPSFKLGSSPSQLKIRERRTWDIFECYTCKNWRENFLLFSTRKPRLHRKNPTVKFGVLAGYPSPSPPTFLSYFRAFFDRSRASLLSTP